MSRSWSSAAMLLRSRRDLARLKTANQDRRSAGPCCVGSLNSLFSVHENRGAAAIASVSLHPSRILQMVNSFSANFPAIFAFNSYHNDLLTLFTISKMYLRRNEYTSNVFDRRITGRVGLGL